MPVAGPTRCGSRLCGSSNWSTTGTSRLSSRAEVVQEILHRFVAIRRPDVGSQMARDARDLLGPVLPITHAVTDRMPDLVGRYPNLAERDLVHVATCLEHGIATIVSPDQGFDEVAEIRRSSLEDAAASN